MPFTQTEISEIYVAVYNRASEGEGNEFWQGFAGTKSELIDATLATSAAQDYFGDSLDTNEAFIEHIYINTLGKTAIEDPDGIAFWVAKLDSGESRGSVVEELIFAAQQPENAGDAQDQFNNRVEVSNYSAETLDKPPEDFATSLAFDGDLIVTSDTATVTTAKASVDVIAAGDGGGSEPGDGGETFLLNTDQDNLTGTDGDDAFNAYIFDNSNTAQSGDMLDGGAGNDSLYADIGDSQDFAITLHTTSIENFAVRAQALPGQANSDNNTGNEADVQIDAERMVGVTRYESNNSRADVLIEDVRIESSEITKDITVAMVQTDPGDVDFGVYFDQHSLRAAPAVTAGAVLNLEIMDTRSADAGLDPLLENPFNGFTFKLDGTAYVVSSDAIDDATTYAEFLTAVQAALLTVEGLEEFTAAISGTFQAIDTLSGNSLTGQVITLTNAGSGIIEEGAWTTADGTVPGGSGLHLEQDTAAPASTGNLITSTIILDDVGRGSMGGDLIIGGLSTGETSSSKGVERFDITVERSSQNQEISSTNNTLQEVYIVNGATKGNLTVAGDTNGDNDIPGSGDGTDPGNGGEGFTDVRVVDASAMTGWVDIDAELTENVVAKYMTLTDDATAATADNVDFMYTLGANNDSLTLTLADDNLAAAGTTTREDFTLVVNGGNGNDTITTSIITSDTGAYGADTENWYGNSQANANLLINGDGGNDTINTKAAGDFTINAGSGNDTVLTDNVGTQTTLRLADTDNDGRVTNADATTSTSNAVYLVNAGNLELTDLAGAGSVLNQGALTTGNSLLFKSTVTVTYSGGTAGNTSGVIDGVATAAVRGFESTVEIGTTNYIGNKTNVNQAIKEAINGDAVLSKLLVATDGPANTLIITALVDGAFADTDLNISVNDMGATAFAALSSSDATGLDTAWELLNQDSTVAAVTLAALTAGATAANAIAGLDTNQDGIADAAEALLATDASTAAVTLVGAISAFESNNVVNLGSGDDVAVLGTDIASNDTLVFAGSFGDDTIVNFDDTAGAAGDLLDFTSYLVDVEDIPVSTSPESQTRIATTLTIDGPGGIDVTSNEVVLVNGFTGAVGETWAGMTAANVLAAIKISNGGADDYGTAALTAGVISEDGQLVGTTQKNILMIENDLNDGEYKVFEVTATDVGAAGEEFTAVTLVGSIDFGATLAATTVVV